MTGDALLAALRTFGPAGATIAQLRRHLNVGAEDLDIGLKVLRQSNRVVILNRRVIIPDYTPRTRLDSPRITSYEDNPHETIGYPIRETLTLHHRSTAEPAEAQSDAA